MIVVSDTSPLVILAKIGCLSLLPTLYERILIPPEVAAELASAERPENAPDLISSNVWLIIQAPKDPLTIRGLNAGEQAAIALAIELDAEFVLMDEKAGRKAAKLRGVTALGTIGVLEVAADRGLVDLADTFDKLKTTDFRIPHEFLNQRLAARDGRGP